MPRSLRLFAPVLLLTLLVASCGDDDDTAATSTTSAPDGTVRDDADDPGSDDTEPERVPDAEAEAPPGDSGGADEGLGDPAVFVADLDGDAEVPGPGDPAGSGRMEAESDADGRLCFDMVAEGLGSDVTDAHIHEGADGESGDVVIPIGPPTASEGNTDTWTDVCVEAGDDAFDVMADPGAFYANVHTAEHGSGAIRGQLQVATIFDLTLS